MSSAATSPHGYMTHTKETNYSDIYTPPCLREAHHAIHMHSRQLDKQYKEQRVKCINISRHTYDEKETFYILLKTKCMHWKLGRMKTVNSTRTQLYRVGDRRCHDRSNEGDLEKRGMQCSCPCKQEEQNKQREKQEQK